MSTLQERFAIAITHYEATKKTRFVPAHLAEFCKTTRAAVSGWVDGPTKDLKRDNNARAALFLGVSEKWLAGDKVPMLDDQSAASTMQSEQFHLDNNVELGKKVKIIHKTTPVISWVQAGAWTDAMRADVTNKIKDIPYNPKAGKNGFGLIVVGESMMPDFKPGIVIYVNPDYQFSDIKSGDLIIVSCAGDTEATFKKIVIEGSTKYLTPINKNWPEQFIPLREDCRFVGKVVGLYQEF